MQAVILTGGQSRRMGRDKALLELDGETVLRQLVDRFAAKFDRVAVSVDRAGRFPTYGAEEIADIRPGKGILSGLEAAFTRLEADRLFVTAVDMPYADPALALELETFLTGAYDAAVIGRRGVTEPAFAVYSRSCLPYVRDCLDRDRLSARGLLAAIRVREVEPEELPGWDVDRVLYNMNRPSDYRRVRSGGSAPEAPEAAKPSDQTPMVSFVGWSGSGKTTYLEKLIPKLRAQGVRLAVIKHDAHRFELDRPGKDSYRFAAAGADTVAIASGEKFALIQRRDAVPPMADILRHIWDVDLILTEGYKTGDWEKIEIHRRATGKPLACGDDPRLLAVVTDEPVAPAVPQFGLEDTESVVRLLMDKLI